MVKTQKYLFENGLAWKDYPPNSFLNNFKEWKKRIKNNSFAAIMIMSPPGRGKTTLAVNIAKKYQEGDPFDYSCQFASGFEDFKNKLEICRQKNKSVIIFDEAGEISNRDALTNANKEFLKILDVYRAYKVFLIICLQRFSMIDSAVLETEIIRAGIYIENKFKSYAVASVYSLADLFKIAGIMLKIRKFKNQPPNAAFKSVQPMIRLKFLPLPPDEQKYLDDLSLQAKQKIILGKEHIKNMVEQDKLKKIQSFILLKETRDLLNEYNKKYGGLKNG